MIAGKTDIMQLFSLKNKAAVVTGALGLLGKQHCKALSEAGANVVICDMDEVACQDFALEMATDSIGCFMDVTAPESVKAVLKKVLTKYDHVDVLVNNAAINDKFESPELQATESRFENYPLAMWQRSLDVNVTGVFNCAQIFGSQMAVQKGGSIINIASTYGVVAPDQGLYRDHNNNQAFYKSPAYSATKGAVISFTRFLAAYWGDAGVRVNTLSPGGVESGQQDWFISNYSNRTPLKRMATRTDYQGALVFLASEASAYMTGANLIIDGGWTTW